MLSKAVITNRRVKDKEDWKMMGDLEVPLEPTPRHTSRLLRLLPSGPGRVHKLSLRGDPRVTITSSVSLGG